MSKQRKKEQESVDKMPALGSSVERGEVLVNQFPDSRRGRYRLVPADLRMLDEIAAWMGIPERARAVRAALTFVHLVTVSKREEACRFLLRNSQLKEQEALYLGPLGEDLLASSHAAQHLSDGETAIWEIRWEPADGRRLHELVESRFGVNESQAVRRLIRLFHQIAKAYREEWVCGWESPQGELLHAQAFARELAALFGATSAAELPPATTEAIAELMLLTEDLPDMDSPYRLASFQGELDRPARLVVTVVASNDGFAWYSQLTQQMKKALGFLDEFAKDRGEEPIRESYLWDDLHRWIRDGYSVLHLVPYFHTRSRRGKGLDVLPYGFHCRFGALIHESHPVWQELAIDPSKSVGNSLPATFFHRLIWQAMLRQTCVRFLEGAILNDLLEDLVYEFSRRYDLESSLFVKLRSMAGGAQGGAENGSTALRMLLQRAWRAMSVGRPGHFEAIPDLEDCRQRGGGFSTGDIVLFDDHAPLNGRGDAWKAAGYRQVSVSHGLPIFTGIGMSTTMRYHLEEKNRGRRILTHLAPVLFRFETELKSLGVDLDREYLERIARETTDHQELDDLFGPGPIDVKQLRG